MTLRDFLITEKLNHEHAERYLTYVDRYHHVVWTSLHKQLALAWSVEIVKITSSIKPIDDMITKRELRVPGIISVIELVESPEKILTTRVRGWQHVSPSVKVPYIYQQETVDLVLKRLLQVAQESFKDLSLQWSEIFHYEKKGQIQPSFHVEVDDINGSVKFKIVSAVGGEEAYKTVYSVNVDYGRADSKIRSFDRVYLSNHV